MELKNLESYVENRIRDLKKLNGKKPSPYLNGQLDALQSIRSILTLTGGGVKNG